MSNLPGQIPEENLPTREPMDEVESGPVDLTGLEKVVRGYKKFGFKLDEDHSMTWKPKHRNKI